MKKALQIEIIKELLEQLDNQGSPDSGKIVVNPASNYTCQSLAQSEWEALFINQPQIIGMSGELRKPGAYLTVDAGDFGVPILATRDTSGKFRAFLNSCRHRGAKLTPSARGEQSRFTCPYHAWTYANDGSLLGVSNAHRFGNIDKSCNSLIELPAAEKCGFLFVHPQRDGVLDIDSLFDTELSEELSSLELDRCEYQDESTFDLPLNWKIANDTFAEQYHFGHLHKTTLANVLHGNVGTFDKFGRNFRGSVANRYIDTMRTQPETTWSLFNACMITYYLFPNVNLVLMDGMFVLARIYPNRTKVGQSLTRVSYFSTPQLTRPDTQKALSGETLYQPDTNTPIVFSVSAMKELFDSTVSQEDYVVGAQIQAAADSGLVEHFIFGRNEPGIQHSHNNFKLAMGLPPLEEY